MDDKTTLMTTVPCTKRLLEKINQNITKGRMKIKPSKCIRISIVNVTDQRFHSDGFVSEKPVKVWVDGMMQAQRDWADWTTTKRYLHAHKSDQYDLAAFYSLAYSQDSFNRVQDSPQLSGKAGEGDKRTSQTVARTSTVLWDCTGMANCNYPSQIWWRNSNVLKQEWLWPSLTEDCHCYLNSSYSGGSRKKKWIEFVHDKRSALHFRDDLVVQVQQGRAGFGLIHKI